MGVFNHDVDGDDIVDDFFNDVLVDVTTDNNDKINNDNDNNVSGRKGLLMQKLYSFFFVYSSRPGKDTVQCPWPCRSADRPFVTFLIEFG